MAKAKLTKAEYDALNDEGKKSYELVGEAAFFTGEIPDVTSLQTALDSERALHQTAANQLKAFTGIDPVKAKEALAAASGATKGKEPDLSTPEGVRAAMAQMQTDFEERLKGERSRADAATMDRTIESTLIGAGVIKEALADAMLAVRPQVKPITEGDPTLLGVLGPQGTFIGSDFSTWAKNDLKKSKPWFFADNGVGGTGGKPADASRANVSTTKTRTEFDAMTPQDKITFSNLVDQGKAALVDS